MSRCRFAWFKNGQVRRYDPADQDHDTAHEETASPARLVRHPKAGLIVEAEMDGTSWYGRFMPKKAKDTSGPVVLYEKTS